LQGGGLIKYARGKIRIVDAEALQQGACECYETVKRQYRRLISPDPSIPDGRRTSRPRPEAHVHGAHHQNCPPSGRLRQEPRRPKSWTKGNGTVWLLSPLIGGQWRWRCSGVGASWSD
jgi:hypothetical protein